MKKRLTQSEEFQVMKLVLDKFLWIGFGIQAYGLFLMLTKSINEGLYFFVAGIVVLFLFLWIIVKEYEVMK